MKPDTIYNYLLKPREALSLLGALVFKKEKILLIQ